MKSHMCVLLFGICCIHLIFGFHVDTSRPGKTSNNFRNFKKSNLIAKRSQKGLSPNQNRQGWSSLLRALHVFDESFEESSEEVRGSRRGGGSSSSQNVNSQMISGERLFQGLLADALGFEFELGDIVETTKKLSNDRKGGDGVSKNVHAQNKNSSQEIEREPEEINEQKNQTTNSSVSKTKSQTTQAPSSSQVENEIEGSTKSGLAITSTTEEPPEIEGSTTTLKPRKSVGGVAVKLSGGTHKGHPASKQTTNSLGLAVNKQGYNKFKPNIKYTKGLIIQENKIQNKNQEINKKNIILKASQLPQMRRTIPNQEPRRNLMKRPVQELPKMARQTFPVRPKPVVFKRQPSFNSMQQAQNVNTVRNPKEGIVYKNRNFDKANQKKNEGAGSSAIVSAGFTADGKQGQKTFQQIKNKLDVHKTPDSKPSLNSPYEDKFGNVMNSGKDAVGKMSSIGPLDGKDGTQDLVVSSSGVAMSPHVDLSKKKLNNVIPVGKPQNAFVILQSKEKPKQSSNFSDFIKGNLIENEPSEKQHKNKGNILVHDFGTVDLKTLQKEHGIKVHSKVDPEKKIRYSSNDVIKHNLDQLPISSSINMKGVSQMTKPALKANLSNSHTSYSNFNQGKNKFLKNSDVYQQKSHLLGSDKHTSKLYNSKFSDLNKLPKSSNNFNYQSPYPKKVKNDWVVMNVSLMDTTPHSVKVKRSTPSVLSKKRNDKNTHGNVIKETTKVSTEPIWKANAHENAREMAMEIEGNWSPLTILQHDKHSLSCPKFEAKYQDKAVIIDLPKYGCKIIITWHNRTSQTSSIRSGHQKSINIKYEPVVTYLPSAAQ